MDLRLATAEEIAISGERRRKRARGMAYRLGLDLLLRQAGAPDFTPVAHTPPKLSAQGFRTFCETVAERDGLQLPTFQEAAAEAAGWERYGHVRALSLVRSRFRRSLELWCWLDRALALQEAGWEVAIGTFTHRSVTPRNVLIEARR
jgi:hypothetical protein